MVLKGTPTHDQQSALTLQVQQPLTGTPVVHYSTLHDMPGHAVLAMGRWDRPPTAGQGGCSSRWGTDQPIDDRSTTSPQTAAHDVQDHVPRIVCPAREVLDKSTLKYKTTSYSPTTASMKPRDITGRPNLAEELSRAQTHLPTSEV
jgi:hypothetical protein